MIALSLMLLLAQNPPTPLQPDVPHVVQAVKVKAGELVPWSGVLISNDKAVEQAKRLVVCDAEQKESSGKISPNAMMLIIAVVLIVGGAGGFAAGRLAK